MYREPEHQSFERIWRKYSCERAKELSNGKVKFEQGNLYE